jgi:hypothetical protein
MSTADFTVDPNNYLGHQYRNFKTVLYKLALTNPEGYFQLRENVLKAVQQDAVKNLYQTIFKLLDSGTTADGTQLIRIDGDNIKVGYPRQQINTLSLSMAETLDEMLEHVVNVIIPHDFTSIMEKKLKIAGDTSVGDTSSSSS